MNILIVDDDDSGREIISKFLNELGHQVNECNGAISALERFSSGYYDLIFSDIKMPVMSGIELVKKIRNMPGGQDVDIILFTGYSETGTAIEALRYGVYDYLLKPVNIEEVINAIERIEHNRHLKKKNELLNVKKLSASGKEQANINNYDANLFEKSLPAANKIKKGGVKAEYDIGINKIGVFSSKMKNIFDYALMLHKDRSIPVLIEGETGCGKEMVAQFIHHGNDNSCDRPFVDLNCACISANLFESELFGYAPGAFTGGLDRGQPGKLDIADNGTIFLDEIADMPFEMQAKLLRVIQEKEYYRVGGLKKIKTDLRIICAANVRLEDRVIDTKFRQDLYYRLNVGKIHIPALRDRREEIIPLALMFLKDIAKKKGKKFKNINPEAESILKSHDWPGNVRQLRNVIERAVFMFDSTVLMPAHLDVLTFETGRQASDIRQSQPFFSKDDRLYGSDLQTDNLNFMPPSSSNFSLDEHINSIIKKALAINGYNKTRTAEYLNITRRTLYTYLKRIFNK